MAKCPRCLARKGKRHCPALDVQICPQCCAEERLQTIACPRDCTYLAGELYQHRRRTERARSVGKAFVESNSELFQSDAARELGFNLRADIYYFSCRNGPIPDEALAGAIEAVIGQTSRVIVLEASRHPVVNFLLERLDNAERYPLTRDFTIDQRKAALERIVRHVRSLGPSETRQPGADTFHHHDLISDFFGSLDFEADLDYSPEDPATPDGPADDKRTPGGIILPS